MKSFFYLLLIVIVFAFSLQAQTPSILVSKNFGGTYDEKSSQMIRTSDGNFIIVGSSESNNGYIHNHHGQFGTSDIWIVKFDSIGSLIWNQSYGGSYYERGRSIYETFDHGFIICGTTNSDDGDVSGLHTIVSPSGSDDMWIVKTDSVGHLQWQHCFGSYDDDEGVQVQQTSDSGFVCMAEVRLVGGDITYFRGSSDWWITKLDQNGNIVWRKTLGGYGIDIPEGMAILDDGSMLFIGHQESATVDVTCSNQAGGVWLVKLDSAGNLLWNNCYGGSGPEGGWDIIKTTNNGFYIAASTGSSDGDVTNHIGNDDFWVLKCDSSGGIIWQNCYGGINSDVPSSLCSTLDGGLAICGYTYSSLSGYHNWNDELIVKLDSFGNVEWEQCYGGSQFETATSILQLQDSSYMVAGYSNSTDGDNTSYHYGNYDFWLLKLGQSPNGISTMQDVIYGVKTIFHDGKMVIEFNSKLSGKFKLNLFDVVGRVVFSTEIKSIVGANNFSFDINVPHGLKILRLENESGVFVGKTLSE